jgi:DNA mismatch repair protein MutS
MEKNPQTPLMKQFTAFKEKYPAALLLFRVGDFYETFGEDAVKLSQIVGTVLTNIEKNNSPYVELSGFPFHSLDHFCLN